MNKLLSLDESLALVPQKANELFETHVNKYLMQIFRVLGTSDLDIVGAQGAEIFLRDGTRMLDFHGGIGVVGIGHNHPRIIRAEQKCHEQLVVDSVRVVPHKLQAALAYNIAQMLPDPLAVSYFCVSGAEAVESAMKLCERVQRPKKKFICIQGSFHGKTHGALSVTTAHRFQEGFLLGVPAENVIVVPFGDVEAVQAAIAASSTGNGKNDVIAVIVEPISGESARVPPKGYLTSLAELCRRSDVLTVFDEVKVGMGRSGAFCAFQHEDVVPDVVTIAKALGGSKRAVGAMVTSQELFDRAYGKQEGCGTALLQFGGLGETCAVAIETLNILRDEKLIERAAENGAYFGQALELLQQKHPDTVLEVYGKGLFRAMRLNFREHLVQKVMDTSKSSLFATARSVLMGAVVRKLSEKGVLVHFQPGAPDIMHFMPPLVVEKQQIDKAVQALDEVLSQGLVSLTTEFIGKNVARLVSFG